MNTTVRNRAHRYRHLRQSLFRMEPCSADARAGPRAAADRSTFDSGYRNSGIPRIGRADNGDLPGLSLGLAALTFCKRREALMPVTVDNGIVNEPTSHSVDQTVERLEAILQAKGVTLFALVDHSGEAAKVGMKMRPTKLLILGNPKAGTPLMLAAPSSAIDLPLKMLVWEDDQGKVWISYNSSQYLQKRHGLPHELLTNIAVVEALAAKAAE
jgi:uncharacterized protein (DUF302 family)